LGGYKSALKNPNVSQSAKQHLQEVLDEQFDGGDTEHFSNAPSRGGYGRDDSYSDFHGKRHSNVLGGLKATLKNPNVSEEAKQRAKERLENGDF
ncbi:hypothetical protein FPQ18DRAFT_254116, partial [Pyronema domesticum]